MNNHIIKLSKLFHKKKYTMSDKINDILDTKLIQKLQNVNKDNCPNVFTMKGKSLFAKVISVYDGDTCNIVFEYCNEFVHHRFRLYGINCKEMKPLKSIENREEYIKCAKEAKKALEQKVLNQIVWIEFVEEEKYGRLMGTIYSDKFKTINFNQEMIKEGHADCYLLNK